MLLQYFNGFKISNDFPHYYIICVFGMANVKLLKITMKSL